MHAHPAPGSAGMFLDLSTFFAITVFSAAMSGALLIYAWFLSRHTTALVLWAAAYLCGAAGAALIIARGAISDILSIDIANTLLIGGYGIMLMGARSFNNRNTPPPYAIAGAAIWLAACQIAAFHESLSARIMLVSAIIVVYTLAIAYELWRNTDAQLMSRWPLIVIFGLHAVVFFSRVLWPGWILAEFTGHSPAISVVALVSFEVLFHTFCAAFLLASIAKERMELRYKRASFIDPLTGVYNRRGFTEYGERTLRRLAFNGHPAALVAFDLDRFKEINDTYGHPVGDRVLCVFCDVVNTSLRPGDLFARVGGEEFACLLMNVSDVEATVIAERIRSRFAKTEIDTVDTGAQKLRATVSAGIAATKQNNCNLGELVLAADQSLYLAKKSGRNRVETERSSPVIPSAVPARAVAAAR